MNYSSFNMINTLNDVDTSTEEGKMFMAALAMITTESRTHQEPDAVIEEIQKLKKHMYDEMD